MNPFTPIVVPTFGIRRTIFYFPAINVVLMTSNIFKFGREIAKRSMKVQKAGSGKWWKRWKVAKKRLKKGRKRNQRNKVKDCKGKGLRSGKLNIQHKGNPRPKPMGRSGQGRARIPVWSLGSV